MYQPSAKTEQVIDFLNQIPITTDEIIILFFAQDDCPDIKKVYNHIKQRDYVIGGIFPALIHEGKMVREGFITKKFRSSEGYIRIDNLDKKAFEYSLLKNKNPKEDSTAFILVDGLSPHIDTMLRQVYYQYGNKINYLGGGAGLNNFQQSPCIFDKDGVRQNSALIAYLDQAVSCGVKHGWKPLPEPLIATATQNNIIEELNWENAFEVYKKIVENDHKTSISNTNFYTSAKQYPLGLIQDGSEHILRDPILVTKGKHLMCVGEVKENSVLYILKASKRKIIQASGESALEALMDVESHNDLLLVDSFTRSIFLNELYPDSLSANKDILPSLSQEGILSLGQIGSHRHGYLNFYSKTIVTAIFKL